MSVKVLKDMLAVMTSFEIRDTHREMVDRLKKPGDRLLAQLTPQKVDAWHMASCIPAEGGELFDAVKRWVIYGKPLDKENVIEELGDLEFYMEGIRQNLGISRGETLRANILKLDGKRYASGKYSDEQAIARADKKDV
jgi:NTP pyrophosphatase (non-canonical NTP hydrolase)